MATETFVVSADSAYAWAADFDMVVACKAEIFMYINKKIIQICNITYTKKNIFTCVTPLRGGVGLIGRL